MIVVPVGGTVDFLNNDRLLHNIHSQSKGNPTFNRTQPKGRAIPITFTKPEIIRIDCDLHPWMRAWVVVAEHPFYAVTGASGEFALGSLPAGSYTLSVWQESLGTVTKDVTVGDGRRQTSSSKWARSSAAAVPPGATRPASSAPVALDSKQCAFTPRVIVVPVGGTVDFLNNDRLSHNIHSQSKGNPTFNRTQPKGRTIPITFTKPEIIRIDCDLHRWMRAWVVVAEHPFYAVTGASGEFALGGLPAGPYTLNVWQESLGTVTKDVTVGEADTAVVIEMGRRKRVAAQASGANFRISARSSRGL